MVEANQVNLAHFMLERDIDPLSNDDQYLVLTQDEGEEGDDGVISYWSEDDGDQFLNKAGRDLPNEGELLYDKTKAIRVWGLLKDEDQSTKLKTLFEEEDEKESGTP